MRESADTKLTATVEALWQEYHETRAAPLRNELLFTFSPMVDYFVQRAGDELPEVEAQGLTDAGFQALLEAIEAYKPEGDESLEQCAWRHMAAAMGEQAAKHARQRAELVATGQKHAAVARAYQPHVAASSVARAGTNAQALVAADGQ